MISKKTAPSKRAPLPRAADYAKTFLKDWERLSHSGRYDMHRLKEAMLLLIANDVPLVPEWLDHPLGGDWQGHRECHVGGGAVIFCWRTDWKTVANMAWWFSCALGRMLNYLTNPGSGIASAGWEVIMAGQLQAILQG